MLTAGEDDPSMTIENKRNRGSSPLPPRRRTLAMKAQHPHKAPIAALFILLLLPVFLPDLFSPLGSACPALFSEWIAPEPAHLHLLEGALQRDMVNDQLSDLWSPLPNQGWQHCDDPSRVTELPSSSQGYIQVFSDGGLNQQRMGICDAVSVAKILNATLVVPHFEVNPVWQDSSSFEDIFDVDHFINILKNDVSIVKGLPKEYAWSTREYYTTGIRATRVKTASLHASPRWYLENVLPIIQRYGIAAISPFSYSLAFEDLSPDIQRLRCKVNFQALTFVSDINTLGTSLIRRLRSPNSEMHGLNAGYLSNGRSSGKYVVVHLRFDKDMAAHSACDFGGERAEKLALAKYRELIWQGRVLNSQFTDAQLRPINT